MTQHFVLWGGHGGDIQIGSASDRRLQHTFRVEANLRRLAFQISSTLRPAMVKLGLDMRAAAEKFRASQEALVRNLQTGEQRMEQLRRALADRPWPTDPDSET
jgi:hypothetical protein